MTKASSRLQDPGRGIYVKAKAEPSWRFWGVYVHVRKMETPQEAYAMAKKNNGAPGIDGVTFEDIEAQGANERIEQIRIELTERAYVPPRARKTEIPKDGGGKVRVLSKCYPPTPKKSPEAIWFESRRQEDLLHLGAQLLLGFSGRELPMGSRRRRLLNRSTHSSVANSTASKDRHGPRRWMSSAL